MIFSVSLLVVCWDKFGSNNLSWAIGRVTFRLIVEFCRRVSIHYHFFLIGCISWNKYAPPFPHGSEVLKNNDSDNVKCAALCTNTLHFTVTTRRRREHGIDDVLYWRSGSILFRWRVEREVESSVPGLRGSISRAAECKNARVLKFTCTLRNPAWSKWITTASLIARVC